MSVSQPVSQPVSHGKPAGKPFSLFRGANLVLTLVVLALVVLAVCVKIWGFVALTFAALPVVPVMFVIFIWISLP